jgi:hypothetical protein
MKNTFFVMALLLLLTGCNSSAGNIGLLQSYPIPSIEAEWIRQGEPIEFEGDQWYPQDGTESLIDSEVTLMGEIRGVQFFTDKEGIRPFDRLYTKFGRNKYRYFKKPEPKSEAKQEPTKS